VLPATPLTADDAAAITALWQACERYDDGRAEIVAADVQSFLGAPRLDLRRDTVGLRADGELVALGVQLAVRHTFVHVLPAWRGNGLGSWLLRWTQDAARRAGANVTGQSLSDREHAAIALL
jgi:GNAT superfamily N-acetyltransferase